MKHLVYISILVFLSSCGSLNIFQGRAESKGDIEAFDMLTKNYAHVLAPDDKLSVSVWNHDDLSIGSAFSIYNSNEAFGKWILIEADSTGSIPYVGSIKLGGLTLSQAENLIAEKMSEYIKKPIVELRVLNREVTILGEVIAPGNYVLEKELNTLVEYVGKAQGFGFYANTKAIQVIRDDVAYKIDLTRLEEMQYKNIYLKADDIIYVPSKKGKSVDMKAPVLIPVASLLTSVSVMITVLKN